MIPFAKQCLVEQPDTIIKEDKAPSHANHAQARVYNLYEVQQLTWWDNSPDFDMIEPSWPSLQRITTKKGSPSSKKDGERAWRQA